MTFSASRALSAATLPTLGKPSLTACVSVSSSRP